MKIAKVLIHNFRTLHHEELCLNAYTLIVGANNSGKSNLIDALRIFYDQLKFTPERDLPKHLPQEDESWMEVEYLLEREEQSLIVDHWLMNNDRFRVRKWLYPNLKERQGIFGYKDGELTDKLFYGARNVSQGKLGDVVYIPAVSKVEDHFKLSGKSEFRDLLNNIVGPIVSESLAFDRLRHEFKKFESSIKSEETNDRRSVKEFEELLNDELGEWGVRFGIDVNAPNSEEIVKNLFAHSLTDNELGESLLLESFGHGLQRHLIYSLIRIAANYQERRPPSDKKEFSPNFQVILFEEPEAFLHPPKQEILDRSLRQLSAQQSVQVVAASHSPHFVSRSIDDIPAIIRLYKNAGRTIVGQIGKDQISDIFTNNQTIRDVLGEAYDKELELELEAARHVLWLNPDRCSLFFSNLVLIVEGLSEQALIQALLRDGKIKDTSKGLYVLDSMEKYNVHRFMNLLGEMKITHSVIYDSDRSKKEPDRNRQTKINNLIEESQNDHTVRCLALKNDLEDLLGVKVPPEHYRWKASFMLNELTKGRIGEDRLSAFCDVVQQALLWGHS